MITQIDHTSFKKFIALCIRCIKFNKHVYEFSTTEGLEKSKICLTAYLFGLEKKRKKKI